MRCEIRRSFINRFGVVERLPRAEQNRLAVLAKAGDDDARERLLLSMTPAAIWLAKRFADERYRSMFEDFFQIANLKFCEALKTWHLPKDYFPYAFTAARQEIIDQMRRMSYKIYSISADEFYHRNKGSGRDEFSNLVRDDISDALVVKSDANPREILHRKTRNFILEKAILNLDPIEWEIVSRKYGLDGFAIHSNLEIAAAMGYHASRICILLGYAVDKIRSHLTGLGLEIFDLLCEGDIAESERLLDEDTIEKLTQIVDYYGNITATARHTTLAETTITRTIKRTGKILPKTKVKIESEYIKIFA